MSPDWARIKREYLRGGTSYAKLAKKFGLSETAVNKKGREENWRELREEKLRKSAVKTVEKLAEQESNADTRLYEAAMGLLEEFNNSVSAIRAEGPMMPEVIRSFGSALRSIQQVLSSRPTQRDIDEQLARIEKLRIEAQREDTSVEVTVSLEGDMSGYAD